MKTIDEAILDAMQELVQGSDFEIAAQSVILAVLKKHINPLLTPPPDAAAMRKAEVARIAEALFIAECDPYPEGHFLRAETFVAYKESIV